MSDTTRISSSSISLPPAKKYGAVFCMALSVSMAVACLVSPLFLQGNFSKLIAFNAPVGAGSLVFAAIALTIVLKHRKLALSASKNNHQNVSTVEDPARVEEDCLNFAIQSNNFTEVKKLIDSGVSLTQFNEKEENYLHIALKSNVQTKLVKLLIEKRPEFLEEKGGKETWEETPLFYAIRYASFEAVKLLCKKGANVNAKNPSGDTPLHLAARFNKPEVILFLTQNGANVNASNFPARWTALHLSVDNQSLKSIDMLLSGLVKADPLIQDFQGNTVLHIASMQDPLNLKIFVKLNAVMKDTRIKNRDGKIALDLLKESKAKNKDIVIKVLENCS